MLNNVAASQPFGDDPASAEVETCRVARQVTAVIDGQAFRHRDSGGLCVVRAEYYADPDPSAAVRHREAWMDRAEEVLDATWRQRWRERDRQPAWIEARWVSGSFVEGDAPDLDWPDVDWLRVEDHTPVAPGGAVGGPGVVTVYQHVTVWAAHCQVTVVIRHPLGLDLDPTVRAAVGSIRGRLARYSG